MTDLTELTPIGTPVATDILYIIQDPSSVKSPLTITMDKIAAYNDARVKSFTNTNIEANINGNTITNLQDKNISITSGIHQDKIINLNNDLGSKVSVSNGLLLTPNIQSPKIHSPLIDYDINAQVGTTYTPVLLDSGRVITTSNNLPIIVTIPPNGEVPYIIGSSITVISIGTGLTSFAIGTGVTINSTGDIPSAPILRARYSSASAIKIAINTWIIVGDIE